MYLLIENTGEITTTNIRMLGLSQKPDAKIGRFGTGLKEAFALLLREKITPIIFSGETKYTFSLNEEGEIGFVIENGSNERFIDGVWHGMSIHKNFGKQDWVNLWMAFREIYCNALDESDFNCTISPVLQGQTGKTRVFLKADQKVLTTYAQMPNNLMQVSERKPLMTCTAGALYAHESTGPTRIYHKGVFIQETKHPGLFDFELTDLKLTESRSADTYTASYGCQDVLAYADSPEIAEFFKWYQSYFEKGEKCNELEFYGLEHRIADKRKVFWLNGWKLAFGTAVATLNNAQAIEAIAAKGYASIVVDQNIYDICKHAGIATHRAILSADEQQGIKVVGHEIPNGPVIWGKLKAFGLTGENPPPVYRIFTQPKTSAGKQLHGFYREGAVYIAQEIMGSDEEHVAILEEMAHYLSNAGDQSIDFEKWLLKALITAL